MPATQGHEPGSAWLWGTPPWLGSSLATQNIPLLHQHPAQTTATSPGNADLLGKVGTRVQSGPLVAFRGSAQSCALLVPGPDLGERCGAGSSAGGSWRGSRDAASKTQHPALTPSYKQLLSRKKNKIPSISGSGVGSFSSFLLLLFFYRLLISIFQCQSSKGIFWAQRAHAITPLVAVQTRVGT